MGRERIDIPVIGIPESEEAGSLRDSLKRLEGVLKD
jgi:hypothetical protein